MPRIAITMTALAAALILSIGCQTSTEIEPLPAGAEPEIVAQGLSRYFHYDMPSVQLTTDKPMSVVVPVTLKADEDLNVQYRFEFYDAGGGLVGPASDWSSMHLPAHARSYMTGTAGDLGARTWRLVIRRAQ